MDELPEPVVPTVTEDEVVENIIKVSALASESEKDIKLPRQKYVSNDLQLVLLGMGMTKYYDIFVRASITLDTFLQLDESDFIELGIKKKADIKTILENIKIYEAKQKKFLVTENPLHDLQIARNVEKELVVLQNYCHYLELQLRKHKLTDYRINWNESASKYLKAFTKTASLQTKILSEKVFHHYGDNHLIGKALKLNNLTLSEDFKKKPGNEKCNRRKGRGKIIFFSIVLGMLCLVVAKYFFKAE